MSPARIGRPSRRQHLPGCRASRGWSCGDARRQPHAPATTRLSSASGDQGSVGVRLLVLLGRPDLDKPAMSGAMGDVADRLAAAVTPGVRSGSAKMWSTAASSGSTVAERQGERHASASGMPGHARRAARSARPCPANMLGRRALEAVDRLLLVADGEQRARHVAGAAPAKNSLGQRADHLPLHRARVLRLVDQDVVEAAVELVEHPLHGLATIASRSAALPTRSSKSSAARARLGRAVALHARASPSRSSAMVASTHQRLQCSSCSADELRLRALRRARRASG